MPLVTFVTATIGRETLSRACLSLDAQTCDDWLHVVAGDGLLPKACGDAARRWEVEFPHYRHEADVRNKAIATVYTPWVAFLDDDDTVDPEYVRHLRDHIRETPDVDVVIFRQTMKHDNGEHSIFPSAPEIVWGNVGISYACRTHLAQDFPFKRSRHEDLLHLVALEASGANIVFSDHIVYYGRGL